MKKIPTHPANKNSWDKSIVGRCPRYVENALRKVMKVVILNEEA
jgi:hypothetical protein